MAHRVDRERSEALARRVRARFRRCWPNAVHAVHHLGAEARYVEGWVVVHSADPFAIEHAWCEVHEHIVDPSYTSYVIDLEPPLVYFGGMRFTVVEGGAALHRGELPIAWSHPTPEYLRAFEAAWREAARRRPSEPLPPTRVVNSRREPFDLFVGRPSQWGNPFRVGRDGTREEIVAKYYEWLLRQPQLLRHVRSLRGKVLGCDCGAEPCHAEVLAELADLGYEDVTETAHHAE